MKKSLLVLIIFFVGFLTLSPSLFAQGLKNRCEIAKAVLLYAGYMPRDNHDHRQLSGYSHSTLTKTFVAGNSYAIVVTASNGADLDIELYDDRNRLITSDTAYSSEAIIYFNVYRTSKFRLVVRNRAGYSTNASIVSGYEI